jgi:phosphatidylserine decarboxylase
VAGPNALSQARALLAPINKDGYKFVAGAVGATILAFLLSLNTLAFLCLIVTGALAFFFRDPYRIVPQREGLVVAPADGVVIGVETMAPPAELNLGTEVRTRVSIFLSLFDVHVIRTPVTGRIDASVHTSGSYKNAAALEAPSENERQSIVIEAKNAVRLGVVLVAGLVARRIVTDVKVGDTIMTGERLGIIRFGSRVDLYLPPSTLLVSEGQRTLAGETIIADLESQEPHRSFQRI